MSKATKTPKAAKGSQAPDSLKTAVFKQSAAAKSKPGKTAPSLLARPKLTMGPLFFHWDPEKRRDFYFKLADEAPVDVVYLGEVVCSKREPFFEPYRDEVIARLQAAGKEVVLSTLALITLEREVKAVAERCASGLWIEANDVAAMETLAGKPFVAGPFINVMNEGALDFAVAQGAKRIVFAVEMSSAAVATLATHAAGLGVETEYLVFGRQPLSVSMRCYHARANGRQKDGCQFACASDPDGLCVTTLDGQEILTVNGTQTMSHGYAVLLREMVRLQDQHITHFRLSPQDMDMARVADLYRRVLDGTLGFGKAQEELRDMKPNVPFINGFSRGQAGLNWAEAEG